MAHLWRCVMALGQARREAVTEPLDAFLRDLVCKFRAGLIRGNPVGYLPSSEYLPGPVTHNSSRPPAMLTFL